MTPWTCTLTKSESENGFWRIQPSTIEIGQELEVDLDSREEKTFVNSDTGTEFVCEVVTVTKLLPGMEHSYFPTELLDL